MSIPIPTKMEEAIFEESKLHIESMIKSYENARALQMENLIRAIMRKHNCTEETARKAIEQMEDIYYEVLIGFKASGSQKRLAVIL